jgi:hypothetical protein
MSEDLGNGDFINVALEPEFPLKGPEHVAGEQLVDQEVVQDEALISVVVQESALGWSDFLDDEVENDFAPDDALAPQADEEKDFAVVEAVEAGAENDVAPLVAAPACSTPGDEKIDGRMRPAFVCASGRAHTVFIYLSFLFKKFSLFFFFKKNTKRLIAVRQTC